MGRNPSCAVSKPGDHNNTNYRKLYRGLSYILLGDQILISLYKMLNIYIICIYCVFLMHFSLISCLQPTNHKNKSSSFLSIYLKKKKKILYNATCTCAGIFQPACLYLCPCTLWQCKWALQTPRRKAAPACHGGASSWSEPPPRKTLGTWYQASGSSPPPLWCRSRFLAHAKKIWEHAIDSRGGKDFKICI